jgi:hypothetical protein
MIAPGAILRRPQGAVQIGLTQPGSPEGRVQQKVIVTMIDALTAHGEAVQKGA